MDHSKHVAIVTGAAQGIGRVYAQALAADGATVVAADLNEPGAAETAELITKEGGKAVAAQVDVSDKASTLALAERVRSEFGAAHILVNNAAIYHSMRNDRQLDVDIDYWRKVLQVNIDGALLMTQAFAPLLIEAGWGRVVNQTSTAAYLGGGGHYGVSKLAVIGLTQGFAGELGEHGITVNAIAPGVIMTEATKVTVGEDVIKQLGAAVPLQHTAGPEDLVGALRFLTGDECAWITGQTLLVDGGLVKRF
ncbi:MULTISPECIES: SDR family oxidoreductase [Streptomyces]|uniref:SDR family oxidoreductase n=1 Tax=Streptomyces evansiae TaxID=3075535 RepID=A0ABU2R125_9ACTN|nr:MULTISPECIES: SDR family oxidoreductase [unclassified Streptomyces]MDT0410408.1 SDR family oxidoreductase [Streptomyces sp. DSM 41979]MYQ57096.1 SDR family oxidoreductase [Streptomyces sp. SID4926]SCE45083.1 NAD(P)-dependent dehydrogenase, short-chain alcohol dehydrogenase family [Streptomyces sp. DfronAA-171]